MSEDIFQTTVLGYFKRHGRQLPWRPPELPVVNGMLDQYRILLSECMLQQTQVPRVIQKYQQFLDSFPTIHTLADASFQEVLSLWQGLGYNRRALYLHQAAKQLQNKKKWAIHDLVACKGIGPNTAAAICVYAYNEPHIFIETNIRTVFIHHFFTNQQEVSDQEIYKMVQKTLPRNNSRQWYWALMDYGTYLKSQHKAINAKSKAYKKQSQFEGSQRQLRAQVVRVLLDAPKTEAELSLLLSDQRIPTVTRALQQDGLIVQKESRYYVA